MFSEKKVQTADNISYLYLHDCNNSQANHGNTGDTKTYRSTIGVRCRNCRYDLRDNLMVKRNMVLNTLK